MGTTILFAIAFATAGSPIAAAHEDDDCAQQTGFCVWQYHVDVEDAEPLSILGCAIVLVIATGTASFVGIITGASNDHGDSENYSCWATGVWIF